MKVKKIKRKHSAMHTTKNVRRGSFRKPKTNRRIYLDHAAATPLSKKVIESMEYYLRENYGNPSALHREGVIARKAIDSARSTIAKGLFAHPDEIIFTGSGTESNNTAILGIIKNFSPQLGHPMSKLGGKLVEDGTLRNRIFETGHAHIITSVIEHPSVLAVCKELEERGVSVTYIEVDSDGIIDLKQLKNSLRLDTILVSIMYANNEIGTIQPLREISKIIRHWRKQNSTSLPFFHTDACQAVNYLDMHVDSLGVDLLTFNGSKIYGPKGTGALFVRRGINLRSILFGGGQEFGIRSGTENVSGIVGLATAFDEALEIREKEYARLTVLRNYLIEKLIKKIPNSVLNGHLFKRLPNNVNMSMKGVESEHLVIELDANGVALSAKSACKSMDDEGSHVIMALGNSNLTEESSIRITLGRSTSKQDIDFVGDVIPKLVLKLQNIKSL